MRGKLQLSTKIARHNYLHVYVYMLDRCLHSQYCQCSLYIRSTKLLPIPDQLNLMVKIHVF